MTPPARRAEGPLRAVEEEWERLRARADEHGRELGRAHAADDLPALCWGCAEGLAILAEMEALVGRLMSGSPGSGGSGRRDCGTGDGMEVSSTGNRGR